ncbi:hypothetical protein [Paenibacillus planticolens]|uniref:Uncharacterized protein n=1 Tax=Paenibacillus planticolens TaxID=2654976 RepID=A0ABX1ZKW6_9BACL|nr:hypothetical protein [Paenibacillus planticolens]NOU99279.1 hypothetical protein [Paenibacillus planticolens]
MGEKLAAQRGMQREKAKKALSVAEMVWNCSETSEKDVSWAESRPRCGYAAREGEKGLLGSRDGLELQ